MTRREAIEILKQHNAWRRGIIDTPTDVKVLGQAIDFAIHSMEALEFCDEVWDSMCL